ncbi:MAG: rhodanese-like domain-containing protein [Alphaproteobacteria bacterium]|nr:rhodanese-like domain-containing protein [Alphaproteobacteria bacterium]
MRRKHQERVIAAARHLGAALCVALLVACSPEVQTIAPQDLMAYLEKGKAGRTFNLVDLRSQEAFSTLHVPGAINVPYELLTTDRLLFLDGLPVIFYDETKPDLARLTKAVGARLPRNVVFLEGGFSGWRAARFPVANGT